MTKDFGLLISHAMTGQTFSFHIIYFDSFHSVDSVGLFIKMYPKAFRTCIVSVLRSCKHGGRHHRFPKGFQTTPALHPC